MGKYRFSPNTKSVLNQCADIISRYELIADKSELPIVTVEKQIKKETERWQMEPSVVTSVVFVA